VNREAQIATVLIIGFALAFLGWAMVYLASAPNPYQGHPNRFSKAVGVRSASIAERPRVGAAQFQSIIGDASGPSL
jgi:hypothetical protein